MAKEQKAAKEDAKTPVKKRRVVKKPETIREKRAKAADAQPKKRRVSSAAKKASTPFAAVGRFLKKIFRPFRFLLWPFKTRPMRFIGRILKKVFLINYIKASWKELKLVTWPNRRQTINLSVAVIVFAGSLALLITLLDFLLDKVFKQLLT